MTLISLAYNLVQAKAWIYRNILQTEASDFEALLQRQMEDEMEKSLGIKVKLGHGEVWENKNGS